MNSFTRDCVGDATTDFNVEFSDQSGFALVLFESSNSEGGRFVEGLGLHFHRVSDAFGIDE